MAISRRSRRASAMCWRQNGGGRRGERCAKRDAMRAPRLSHERRRRRHRGDRGDEQQASRAGGGRAASDIMRNLGAMSERARGVVAAGEKQPVTVQTIVARSRPGEVIVRAGVRCLPHRPALPGGRHRPGLPVSPGHGLRGRRRGRRRRHRRRPATSSSSTGAVCGECARPAGPPLVLLCHAQRAATDDARRRHPLAPRRHRRVRREDAVAGAWRPRSTPG